MEEALHDVPLYREFAGLEGPMRRLPDESTILRFRYLLEKRNLGDAIPATVNVPLQLHVLMLKTGTVLDATLISAPSSTKNGSGKREVVADAGYQAVMKRPEASGVKWTVAMRPGNGKALDKARRSHQRIDELERLRASIRAKVEHPFRVIKRQFGFTRVRYRGLAKGTGQLKTLFALSKLWMARRRLMAVMG